MYGFSFNFVLGISGCIPASHVSLPIVDCKYSTVSKTAFFAAAEIYSFSLRHLMGMAVTDPVWGWLVVRLGIAHNRLISILGPRAKRDLMIGIKSKRFSIPDVDMATAITFGALLSAIYTHLENPSKEDPSAVFAETMLRMVGIAPEEAKRITKLPMPALPVLN